MSDDETEFYDAEERDLDMPEHRQTYHVIASEARLQSILKSRVQTLTEQRRRKTIKKDQEKRLVHDILQSVDSIHAVREMFTEDCLLYKLAVQVTVDVARLRPVIYKQHNIFSDLDQRRSVKVLISVPDLFLLPIGEALFLGTPYRHQTGSTLQLDENRGRRLRVFLSPETAYMLGSLRGWQLREHYWTRHFLTCRDSLVRCIAHYVLAFLLRQHPTLSPPATVTSTMLQRLEHRLGTTFPLQLAEFLRGHQRLVAFRGVGDMVLHGTNAVTVQRLYVNDILSPPI